MGYIKTATRNEIEYTPPIRPISVHTERVRVYNVRPTLYKLFSTNANHECRSYYRVEKSNGRNSKKINAGFHHFTLYPWGTEKRERAVIIIFFSLFIATFPLKPVGPSDAAATKIIRRAAFAFCARATITNRPARQETTEAV